MMKPGFTCHSSVWLSDRQMASAAVNTEKQDHLLRHRLVQGVVSTHHIYSNLSLKIVYNNIIWLDQVSSRIWCVEYYLEFSGNSSAILMRPILHFTSWLLSEETGEVVISDEKYSQYSGSRWVMIWEYKLSPGD